MEEDGNWSKIMNEELKEQIKLLVRKAIKEKLLESTVEEPLTEKLEVSQGIKAWIDDFQKSDVPQLKGKDKEMRRKMAIAAFKSAERKADSSKDRRAGDRRKGDRRKAPKKSNPERSFMKHQMAIDAVGLAGKLAFSLGK